MVARPRALKQCGLAICTLLTFHGAALADGTACKYFTQLPDELRRRGAPEVRQTCAIIATRRSTSSPRMA